MTYTVSLNHMPQQFKIIVVGCGGTGSFVAEGLCRLLIGSDIPILLIDPDRVELHNLVRQNFYGSDLDKFKSQALAERLSRQFHRRIAYSVYPFMPDLIGESFGGGLRSPAIQGIIIGCVDNADARREIGKTLHFGNWWLDAGYSELVDKVVDRNADGYDPDGPYDIDSVDQGENGEWIPIKIEVKGHLDPEVWGFELSRQELETALNDLGSPYYVYLVLNLRDTNVQIHKLDFRKLWRDKRLNYQSQRIDIALRPA